MGNELNENFLSLFKLMHPFHFMQFNLINLHEPQLINRCVKTFQQLKRDYATLKKKLESYFQVPETEISPF